MNDILPAPPSSETPSADEEQHFDNATELSTLATVQISASRRYVDLLAGDADLPAYKTAEFIESVKQLVLSSPHSRVRILLLTPQTVVSDGHALVELALRLSSHMEVRVLAPEFQGEAEGLLIADHRHCLQRHDPRRCSGTAYFNAPRRAKHLLNGFEDLWNCAEPDPNFRRLML